MSSAWRVKWAEAEAAAGEEVDAKAKTGFKVITEAREEEEEDEEAPTAAGGNGTITGVAVAREALP